MDAQNELDAQLAVSLQRSSAEAGCTSASSGREKHLHIHSVQWQKNNIVHTVANTVDTISCHQTDCQNISFPQQGACQEKRHGCPTWHLVQAGLAGTLIVEHFAHRASPTAPLAAWSRQAPERKKSKHQD
jgi:hypothetical protein